MKIVETTAELLDIGDVIVRLWNEGRWVKTPPRKVVSIRPLRLGGFDIVTEEIKSGKASVREFSTTEPVEVKR